MENKNLSEQMAKVLSGLTDEQKEKVKACKGLDEIAACLGELGVALPDELLDKVAGGAFRDVPVLHRVINPAGTPVLDMNSNQLGTYPFGAEFKCGPTICKLGRGMDYLHAAYPPAGFPVGYVLRADVERVR